jgi:hypothetical protein
MYILALHSFTVCVCVQLLRYDPAEALPVSSFPLSVLPEAHPTINCFQALDYLCVILYHVRV